jgi:hypothetical protein
LPIVRFALRSLVMIRTALSIAFALALSACATTTSQAGSAQGPQSSARWTQCEAQVSHWCDEHAHGDPAHASECRRDAQRLVSSAADDAARDRVLRDHGCTL